MGCGMSAEEREQRKLNDEIDSSIKKEKMALAKEVKMLLLGIIIIDLKVRESLESRQF